MSLFDQVRDQVEVARWRCVPHGGFAVRPMDTFKDIISSSFSPVQSVWRTASHCRLNEMYQPLLGNFRRSKSYSSLAPSHGMPRSDRYVERGFGPYRSYEPKQGEWRCEKEKGARRLSRSRSLIISDHQEQEKHENLTPRRSYYLPTSTTRFDNYFLYWNGRLHGVSGAGALFYPSNFEGAEDRRYHRVFWGQNMMDYVTPSARHAASLLLSAY